MEKIYKPKYSLTNRYIYLLCGIPLGAIWMIAGIVSTPHFPLKGDIWLLIFMGIMFLFFEFVFIVESKVTVIINDDGLSYKRLDKKVEVKWDEINKVGGGCKGICYDIVTKKGRLPIPSTLDSEDLFNKIEIHTGKRVKWGI